MGTVRFGSFVLTMVLVLAGCHSIKERQAGKVVEDNPQASVTEVGIGETIAHIRQKAEAGNALAQSSLGRAYLTGKGVEKDFTQAAFWFRKAAEQEEPQAQYNLGLMYYLGAGGGLLTVQEAMEKARAVRQERKIAFNLVEVAQRQAPKAEPDGDAMILTDDRAPVNWLKEQEIIVR